MEGVPNMAVFCPLHSTRTLQVVKPVLGTQPGREDECWSRGEGGNLSTLSGSCVLSNTASAQGLFQGELVCAFG